MSSLISALMLAMQMVAAPKAAMAQAPPRDTDQPWVKEGTRILYYVASCRVPGNSHYFTKSPGGEWVDQQGNHYDENYDPGQGGAGCTELDILGVEGPAIVLYSRSWSHFNNTGPLIPIGGNGVIVKSTDTDWWMTLPALRAMPLNAIGPNRVLRGPWKVLHTGKVYNNTLVIRRQSEEGTVQEVYDLDSGIMLHKDSSLRAANGDLGVERSDFVDLRSVDLPWKGAAAPAWFGEANSYTFVWQGSKSIFVPGALTQSMAMAAKATIRQKGQNWALLDFETELTLPPALDQKGKSLVVSGPSQVGALWIKPEILAALKTGQLLDQDNYLGIRVEVGPVGNGMAVITETGKLHSYSYGYDLTNGILKAEVIELNNGARNHSELRLTAFNKN